MPKRKGVMKNIIYELDNDDIEISSEDEVSNPKLARSEPQRQDKTVKIVARSEPNDSEVLIVDSTDESICVIDSPNPTANGGKTNSNIVTIDSLELTKTCEDKSQDGKESDCIQINLDNTNINFTEDIVVDSPHSLCIAGCQNRVPLVTMRFKNSKISSSCKTQVKEFIVNLLKEKQEESLAESDNDSDHELDIWPEDVIVEEKSPQIEEELPQTEEEPRQIEGEPPQTDKESLQTIEDPPQTVEDPPQKEENPPQIEENLNYKSRYFFVDTKPCTTSIRDIPRYSNVSPILLNVPHVKKPQMNMLRRPPKCFNCDGDHWLRECKYPRDPAKIAEKRFQNKTGRYHCEDEQKYGHLTPGRISGALRYALGLKRDAIPLHIYKMRILGYPPGWLEEARISHSGISMFDSTGKEIIDPEDEDGEICEAGSKDQYDIKKILDFPGFNVPASSRYVEEAQLFGLPPMSEQDSKISMLQMLAPNAMKAYKRKKLTLFPSNGNASLKEGHAEMDLDSGNEEAEFPSVPPLPDEAPPPPPPPPEQPPPPSPQPPADNTSPDDLDPDTSNLEITSVVRVSSIPLPEDSIIVIDECYENDKPDSGGTSPSLDDLEQKKQDLMKALEGDASVANPPDTSQAINAVEASDKSQDMDTEDKYAENIDEGKFDSDKDDMNVNSPSVSSLDSKEINNDLKDRVTSDNASTPEPKTGHVKTTSFGTPVLNNLASSFVSLPSDEKFAKQICDVLNFENLPNSTGKYEQIRGILKKVKTEVDRIQDS